MTLNSTAEAPTTAPDPTEAHRSASTARKPVANRIWLKVLLVLAVLVPPLGANLPMDRMNDIIFQVLVSPVAESIKPLRITFKWLLFATMPFAMWLRFSGLFRARAVLGYYAVALVLIAFLQNWSNETEWGSVFLLGNALAQLVVVAFLVADVVAGKSTFEKRRSDRLWLLIPMMFAWAWPYSMDVDIAVPPSDTGFFSNGAGVAFCLVTPVVLGLMLIFVDSVHRPTLAVAGWVGSIFGVLNMLTWFVGNADSWWMGVCHLPLLFTSAWAAWEGRWRKQAVSA